VCQLVGEELATSRVVWGKVAPAEDDVLADGVRLRADCRRGACGAIVRVDAHRIERDAQPRLEPTSLRGGEGLPGTQVRGELSATGRPPLLTAAARRAAAMVADGAAGGDDAGNVIGVLLGPIVRRLGRLPARLRARAQEAEECPVPEVGRRR
jgi:hypothetical protein